MILLDVNVIVYAYKREEEHHAHYADWLNDVAAGTETLALTNGARIATADAGFSRFEGLAWFDPAS